MPRVSAGLLMYRKHEGKFEVLLVHPGGPFFKNKDDGPWSIPKGEVDPNEELLAWPPWTITFTPNRFTTCLSRLSERSRTRRSTKSCG